MMTIETKLSEMVSAISGKRKLSLSSFVKFLRSTFFLIKIAFVSKKRPSQALKPQNHSRFEEINWSDTIIYTALFGDYDNFVPPTKNSLKNIKCFIIFTDQDLKFNCGEKIQIVKLDINGIENASAIFFAHPDRGDVLSEILYCLYRRRISFLEFQSLQNFIRANDVGSHPLFEANIILRRNSPAAQRQGSMWWQLYQEYPYRDQFLLFQSIAKSGLRFETRDTQNGNSRINRFAVKIGHKR